MASPRPWAIARDVAWAFVGIVLAFVVAVAATGLLLPKCGACHRGSAFRTATQASAHGSVDCASCHVGKGMVQRTAFAFEQVVHLASPVFKSAAAGSAAVGDERCLSCHGDIESSVSNRNGLRIKHTSCAKGSLCTDCHSNTAHGSETGWSRTYTMDQCLHCHGSEPRLSKCDLCHRGRRTQERLTTGPWRVTHGPNWQKTHGMGDQFTCPTCHPKGYCDRCHGPGLPHTPTFRRDHPTVALNPKAKCTGCHKPTFCVDCHGTQMPHRVAFIKTHAGTVKTQGKALCQRCHEESDCVICHVMHVHPGGAVQPNPLPKVGN